MCCSIRHEMSDKEKTYEYFPGLILQNWHNEVAIFIDSIAAGKTEGGKLGFGYIGVVKNVEYPNVDVRLSDELTKMEFQEKGLG